MHKNKKRETEYKRNLKEALRHQRESHICLLVFIFIYFLLNYVGMVGTEMKSKLYKKWIKMVIA